MPSNSIIKLIKLLHALFTVKLKRFKRTKRDEKSRANMRWRIGFDSVELCFEATILCFIVTLYRWCGHKYIMDLDNMMPCHVPVVHGTVCLSDAGGWEPFVLEIPIKWHEIASQHSSERQNWTDCESTVYAHTKCVCPAIWCNFFFIKIN